MARKNDDAAVPAGAVTAKTKKTRKPKKRRWYHQVWDAYTMTRQQDPAVVWWILGTFLVILGIALGVGFVWGHPIYMTVLGLPTAVLAAGNDWPVLLCRRLLSCFFRARTKIAERLGRPLGRDRQEHAAAP